MRAMKRQAASQDVCAKMVDPVWYSTTTAGVTSCFATSDSMQICYRQMGKTAAHPSISGAMPVRVSLDTLCPVED